MLRVLSFELDTDLNQDVAKVFDDVCKACVSNSYADLQRQSQKQWLLFLLAAVTIVYHHTGRH